MKHTLKTKKNLNFEIFREVLLMMERNKHLSHDGVEKIRQLAARMNRGQSR